MRRGLLATAALGAGLWGFGCSYDLGSRFRETVDETRNLAPTGEFSLENTNGSIHLRVWNEPRVRIEATKAAGSRRALEDLRVVIEGEGDRVAVRTRQPHGGWFLHRGGWVQYSVTVPRGARISLRNVNGRVEVDDAQGAVRASTVNGSVEGRDLGGEIDVATTNGSVEVTMARVDPAGHNSLRTTNGSVRLTLPRDVEADLEAQTVNGGVHCDFDLGGSARVSRRRLEGRIGKGGARFELRTVNGAARVERGLSSAPAAAAPPAEATPSPAR